MGIILTVKVKEGCPEYKDYDIVGVTGRVSSIEYGKPYASVPVRLDGMYNNASREGFFYISKRFLQVVDYDSTIGFNDYVANISRSLQCSSETKVFNLEENKMENFGFENTVEKFYGDKAKKLNEEHNIAEINAVKSSVAGKKLLAFIKDVKANGDDFENMFTSDWLTDKELKELDDIRAKYEEDYDKLRNEHIFVLEALKAADTFQEKMSILNAYGIVNVRLYN